MALLILIALVLPQIARASSPGLPPLPLGIPVPSNPTLGDLLSTSTQGGDVQSVFPGVDFCRSAPRQPIRLPADDSSHPNMYLEWWQWNGVVSTRDGHRLAFFITFENGPWAGIQTSQYTITDLTGGSFHQRTQAVIPGAAKLVTNGFDLCGSADSAVGGNGRDQLHLALDGYQLVLSLKALKPPVLQMGDGHAVVFCNTFNLYTRMRMRVTGKLTRAGRTTAVRGLGKFDHTWGFYPGPVVGQSRALNLHLADGRDIFIGDAQLPGTSAPLSWKLGSIQSANGKVVFLHRGDFTLTPTRVWHPDATCSYPIEWDVTVKGLHLHIAPTVDASDLRTTDPVFLAL